MGQARFPFVLSLSLPISLVLSFVISLVRIYSFLGQAWAEGKGELATCRSRAGIGRELVKMYAAIV